MRIRATGLTQRIKGGREVLAGVSATIEPGRLTAIVGASGSGKTTLLDALAGVRPAGQGTVHYDATDFYAHLAGFRDSLGYVPQDDIIHRDLPLRRVLRYAAELRLPAGTPREELDRAVDDALAALELGHRADVPVRALSGGQRKRASIAVELLTRPRVFFLDEPTSGLDPATAAELMAGLRRLAEDGTTILITTHNPDDLYACDAVLVLAEGGRLVFDGPPDDLLASFRAENFSEFYVALARAADLPSVPADWGAAGAAGDDGPPPARAARAARPLRQFTVLTRRNADILRRNPLTLSILVASPLCVVLMYVLLFKPGVFDPARPSPSATIMVLFWVAFASFFFGLTYGLLQICTEIAIVRRERHVGLAIAPYVLSKLVILLPILLLVDVVMYVVLRAFDRLPEQALAGAAGLVVSLLLIGAAALAIGLLTSAAVSDPAQGTIALPMLCFPQVLFSGAILAVPVMGDVGQALSHAMPMRWGFEALARGVDLDCLLAGGGSPLGPPLAAEYGGTLSGGVAGHWVILGASTLVLLIAACWVLARKCRPGSRLDAA